MELYIFLPVPCLTLAIYTLRDSLRLAIVWGPINFMTLLCVRQI